MGAGKGQTQGKDLRHGIASSPGATSSSVPSPGLEDCLRICFAQPEVPTPGPWVHRDQIDNVSVSELASQSQAQLLEQPSVDTVN